MTTRGGQICKYKKKMPILKEFGHIVDPGFSFASRDPSEPCAKKEKKGEKKKKQSKKWEPHWSMSKLSFSLADLMILHFVWHDDSMFYELF